MTHSVSSESLDHFGIVAGWCQELNLASLINSCVDRRNEHAKVTVGDAAVALILNGFGFVKRSLYMTSQFFKGKPVAQLLGKDIQASDLNDDTLGRALDTIAEYGPEKLFASVAFEIGKSRGLLGKSVHLDTTSISLNGEYDTPEEAGVIRINHGYSKDHRHDLKQFILSMTVTGPASMPIWSETLSGNVSDKASFHETIERVQKFREGLQQADDFLWVADSALYSKEKLLSAPSLRWLTRVPETVKECRELVGKNDEDILWNDLGNGYKISPTTSSTGGIEQRWLLVYSEKAFERERATFEKNIESTEKKLERELWHLENRIFENKEAACAQINIVQKKYPLHVLSFSMAAVHKYHKKGRPSENSKKEIAGFQIEFTSVDFNAVEAGIILNRKGRFVLATNELDTAGFPDQNLLNEYKLQQDVERGFRFLKDTEFGVSDVFLKNPKRIMALMCIMSLCLMVYNIGQFDLRKKLDEHKETVPDQLGKATGRPTLRWIFQLFQDIALVRIDNLPSVVTNVDKTRVHILRFFPPIVGRFYGLEAAPDMNFSLMQN